MIYSILSLITGLILIEYNFQVINPNGSNIYNYYYDPIRDNAIIEDFRHDLYKYDGYSVEYLSRLPDNPQLFPITFTFDRTDSNVVYLLQWITDKPELPSMMKYLFKSTDQGLSWVNLGTINIMSNIYSTDSGNLYALSAVLNHKYELMNVTVKVSRDGGISWQSIYTLPFEHLNIIDNSTFIVNNSADLIYIQGKNNNENLFYATSIDSGTTFTIIEYDNSYWKDGWFLPVLSPSLESPSFFVFDSNSLYYTNDITSGAFEPIFTNNDSSFAYAYITDYIDSDIIYGYPIYLPFYGSAKLNHSSVISFDQGLNFKQILPLNITVYKLNLQSYDSTIIGIKDNMLFKYDYNGQIIQDFTDNVNLEQRCLFFRLNYYNDTLKLISDIGDNIVNYIGSDNWETIIKADSMGTLIIYQQYAISNYGDRVGKVQISCSNKFDNYNAKAFIYNYNTKTQMTYNLNNMLDGLWNKIPISTTYSENNMLLLDVGNEVILILKINYNIILRINLTTMTCIYYQWNESNSLYYDKIKYYNDYNKLLYVGSIKRNSSTQYYYLSKDFGLSWDTISYIPDQQNVGNLLDLEYACYNEAEYIQVYSSAGDNDKSIILNRTTDNGTSFIETNKLPCNDFKNVRLSCAWDILFNESRWYLLLDGDLYTKLSSDKDWKKITLQNKKILQIEFNRFNSKYFCTRSNDYILTKYYIDSFSGFEDKLNYSIEYNLYSHYFQIKGSTNISSFNLFSLSGSIVHSFSLAPGQTEVSWQGTDSNGNQLPSGIYFARAEDEHGNVATAKVVLIR